MTTIPNFKGRPSPARIAVLLAAVLASTLAFAQSDEENCAMGQLDLVSPDRDGLSVTLATGARFGAVVEWDDLDDSLTTCAVVLGADTLDIDVTLTGLYHDIVDRELVFTASQDGVVSGTDSDILKFEWTNRNQEFTGRIVGEINLSNNGGVFALSTTGAGWEQLNGGLPQFMSQTDVVALAASPMVDGRFATHLQGRLGRGLWYREGEGAAWGRIAEDIFPDDSTDRTAVTAIAFSPTDAESFVIGTKNEGLYLTADGGVSFSQIQTPIEDAVPGDSGVVIDWNTFRITTIEWAAADRLYVGIANLGLFISADGGTTFEMVTSLTYTVGGINFPHSVNDVVHIDTDEFLVGVDDYGVYRLERIGGIWETEWIWVQIQTTAPLTVNELIVDPADPDVLIAALEDFGIARSTNGGDSWLQVPAFDDPETPPIDGMDAAEDVEGVVWNAAGSLFLAAVDDVGIYESTDGLTWMLATEQPTINNFKGIIVDPRGIYGAMLSTYAGGIYQEGTALPLTSTIVKNLTDPEYRDLDVGLFLSFDGGVFAENEQFSILAQDFQGYGVWRSGIGDDDEMELIGLYDKNNPETCIEGYCGAESYVPIPRCYVDKRAACFDFSEPGRVRFFDDNIFDGFVYQYAVSTFDYGNTANASPSSLDSDQVFSPRYLGDELSPFDGNGNRVEFRVNRDAPPAGSTLEEDQIFVYPNPLRNTSVNRVSEGSGEVIHFSNLPDNSRVMVFTVDGDIVADLGGEGVQEGRNIAWVTRNEEGDLLASGVYIYKVVMGPGVPRDDYFGKLVIIR